MVTCLWQVEVCRDSHCVWWWAACMSSHCHYGHYVSPVIKASPAELPTMKISLLPTSPKATVLQIWVMMFPEKAWFFWDWLSRISRHGHSSIYPGAAASSLQRQDSSEYLTKEGIADVSGLAGGNGHYANPVKAPGAPSSSPFLWFFPWPRVLSLQHTLARVLLNPQGHPLWLSRSFYLHSSLLSANSSHLDFLKFPPTFSTHVSTRLHLGSPSLSQGLELSQGSQFGKL